MGNQKDYKMLLNKIEKLEGHIYKSAVRSVNVEEALKITGSKILHSIFDLKDKIKKENDYE